MDAVTIVVICGCQIGLGSRVWRRVFCGESASIVERFGMGGAVGFSLSLISAQIFQDFLPRQISWIAFPILILILIEVSGRHRLNNAKVSPILLHHDRPMFQLLVVISGTLFALSTSWFWLVPTALIFAGILVVFESFKIFLTRAKLVQSIRFFLILLLTFFGIRTVLNLARVEEIRNPVWWSLRFGLIEDADLVFNESMINSVATFGFSDNIFFTGVPLRYHLFSFGWEATLKSFRDIEPFVISGIVGPVIIYFVLLCLVYSFASTLSQNRYAPILSVALISMACVGPIPLLRILNPYSFSYNFSLIFVFAILLFVLKLSHKLSLGQLLIFGLLCLVAVGSKASSFIVLGFGLIFTMIVSLRRKRNVGRIFALNFMFLSSMTLLWVFVFRADVGQRTSGIKFAPGELFIQKANFFWSSSPLVLALGFLSVCLALAYFLSGLLVSNADLWNSRNSLRSYVLASGFGGIASAFVLTDSNESSAYLLGSGLAVLAPISVVALVNSISKLQVRYYVLLVGSACLGLFTAGIWDYLYEHLDPTYDDPTSSSRQIKQSLIVLLPFCVATVSSLLVAIKNKSEKAKLSKLSFATCLLTSVLASYFANAHGFYQTGVNNREASTEISTSIFGSAEYRELLIWAKENSKQYDLFATNRQCLEVTNDLTGCTTLWSLTSAIADRQNLVEGLYPPRTEHLTTERESRWNAVIGFVENPTNQNRDALIDYGVKWVVADHAITKTRNWEPFATERFKNLAGSILELNP